MRVNMKRVILYIFALLPILASCNKEEKAPTLLGTWELISITIETYQGVVDTAEGFENEYYLAFDETKAIMYVNLSTTESEYVYNGDINKLTFSKVLLGRTSPDFSKLSIYESFGGQTYEVVTLTKKELLLRNSFISYNGSTPYRYSYSFKKK